MELNLLHVLQQTPSMTIGNSCFSSNPRFAGTSIQDDLNLKFICHIPCHESDAIVDQTEKAI